MHKFNFLIKDKIGEFLETCDGKQKPFKNERVSVFEINLNNCYTINTLDSAAW